MIGVCSPGIRSIPLLSAFLGDSVTIPEKSPLDLSTIAVWGRRPTSQKGENFARKHGLPILRLEDGFLRSLDLGCNGAPPLSLVVDGQGIYYDARQPSDLEQLLELGDLNAKFLQESEHALAAIVKFCLSKYNHAPTAPAGLLGDTSRTRILIIDQTVGDMSVGLGAADASSFQNMVEAAKSRFPEGRFFVKTHPDVIAGKKKGYLRNSEILDGITVIAEDFAPLSLLAQTDVVFTVTSQMGFEALLLGKEVHCFGLPFYAGWGVTKDELSCERRTRKRSTLEIFAAAYIIYARYVNPFTGQRCDIHEIIRILARQREMNERNAGHTACLNFSRWKHPHAQAFLSSTNGATRFFSSQRRAITHAAKNNGRVVVWSSRASECLEQECKTAGIKLVRMEDGFIRSAGLGSDFHWPYSLVLDEQGIYYDPSRPSRLETILQFNDFSPELQDRAKALRLHILAQGITKYNVSANSLITASFPKNRRIVLVPGQVEDDASVRLGGGDITSNLELLAEVRRTCPDAFILYKPHPDVERSNRQGKILDVQALRHADQVLRDANMHHLLNTVDEVHTLTSLTGFEALLRDVPVHTYGGPFYAGWGMTRDRLDFPRRERRLAIDELVAGTLILYPTYFDWRTGMFCGPEEVCSRLRDPSSKMQGKFWVRLLWSLREIWKQCENK